MMRIMPRLIIGLSILALIAVLGTYLGARYQITSRITSSIEKLAIPYRMVRLAAQPPDSTILMPVEGVRVEQVADTWGADRGAGRRHEGQDIFASRGTPIYSGTSGYVVAVRENQLGGNVVVVVGAGRRAYYYAHLDTYGPDAVVGKQVATTSILGYVGTSGNAVGTPPHLHFGIYTGSGAIDPLPLLISR
jgi:peptidoglycan LD-endopeptidase LytH